MPARRRLLTPSLALALFACSPTAANRPPEASRAPPAAAPPAQVHPTSSWSRIEVSGAVIGREHDEVSPLGDGLVESRGSAEMQIRQLGTPLAIRTTDVEVEDAHGVLRSTRSEMHAASLDLTTEVVVRGLTATVTKAGETPRTIALTESLLGPHEMQRRTAALLRGPGDHLDFLAWSDELGAPARTHIVVEAVESVPEDGIAIPAVRLRATVDGESSPTVYWVDREGVPVRVEKDVNFGRLTIARTKSEPPAITDAPSLDTMDRTVVRTDVRLPDARELNHLVVRITPTDSSVTLPSLEGPGQHVLSREARPPHSVVLAIDQLPVPPPSVAIAPAPHDEELLGNSGAIEPRDEGVQRVVAEVTKGITDPWIKAQRLTEWVTAHMTYDPRISNGAASVLVKDLHGTCAAYATLLTSLTRAAGIPAREVGGFLYLGGVFGGHAWTEVRIDGRWIPLDATAGNKETADAGRIAVARDMTAPGGQVPMLQMLGHVKLDVVEFSHPGERIVQIGENDPPYSVNGTTYRNAALGLSLTLPPGGEYRELDSVWPNPAFITAKVGGTDLVVQELDMRPNLPFEPQEAAVLQIPSTAACTRWSVDGEPACDVVRSSGEIVAFRRGSSLFVVGAVGGNVHETLIQISKALHFDRK